MRAPESHHETDLTLGSITDQAPEVAVPTSRSRENRTVPENQNGQEDLEKALNESRKSESRLRKIIDTIPTLAWCNLPDGSNEFLNQRWHDYTGVSPEEARGSGWKIPIHPEDLPGLAANWETLPSSDKPLLISRVSTKRDCGVPTASFSGSCSGSKRYATKQVKLSDGTAQRPTSTS
jgi:PAS domain-containing protein